MFSKIKMPNWKIWEKLKISKVGRVEWGKVANSWRKGRTLS